MSKRKPLLAQRKLTANTTFPAKRSSIGQNASPKGSKKRRHKNFVLFTIGMRSIALKKGGISHLGESLQNALHKLHKLRIKGIIQTPIADLNLDIRSKMPGSAKNLDNFFLAAMEELIAEAEDIIEESETLVPVDTGALRASTWIESSATEDMLRVRLGYGYIAAQKNPKTGIMTNEYAMTVHEEQRSHRVGMAHYLAIPFYKRASSMPSRLAYQLRAQMS